MNEQKDSADPDHYSAVAYVPSNEHGVVVPVGGFHGLCLRCEGLQGEVCVQSVSAADLVELCGTRLSLGLQTRIGRAVISIGIRSISYFIYWYWCWYWYMLNITLVRNIRNSRVVALDSVTVCNSVPVLLSKSDHNYQYWYMVIILVH